MRIIALILLTSLIACQTRSGELPQSTTTVENQSVLKYKVSDPELNEVSGIVASRQFAHVLWVHNDSGDQARIFAISDQGKKLGTVYLNNIKAIDWEDIAIGPGPVAEKHYLYIADIGDNRARRDVKTIYRILEPDVKLLKEKQKLTVDQVDAIRFRFPDGSRDAESLMSDPLTGDLYILSKREAQVGLYRLTFPQNVNQVITAEFLMHLPITQAVAGEISPDGKHILVKNYQQIFYWKRLPEQSVQQAMKSFPQFLPYFEEPQGEAICFAVDGSGYFTLSEKPGPAPLYLYFYQRDFK